MKKYLKKELDTLLEKHKLWIRGREGGERANLTNVDLTNVDLSGVDLNYAKLMGANLINANLRNVDFSQADLRNANLSQADLMGANLSYANLEGANLRNVDFTNVALPEKTWAIFGEAYFIFINNGHVQAGCQLHSAEKWRSFSKEELFEMGEVKAVRFYPRLMELIDFYCGSNS